MEENQKKKEIALFRFGLISPVLNDNVRKQWQYFKEVSEKTYDVPYLGRKKFKPETLKSWLKKYRRRGFDALMPKLREDRGISRKITPELAAVIEKKVEEYSALSCAGIYRILIAEGDLRPGQLTEGTVRNFIKNNNLKQKGEPDPRKKFEKEHINMLWIGDCLHGPYLNDGRKKHKVFLIAIIDDHSRMIVDAEFFFHENSICLAKVLKYAILRHGLPDVFYCDNGSLFTSAHLQLACARLGIALVHSRPYDSPSRGKIERFFRTVRQKFLATLRLSEIDSIEILNELFTHWLDHEYTRHHHHGIKEKPIDKYMRDLNSTNVKKVTEEELDEAFQITLYRKVKNDSTVSIKNALYECPSKFIGKKIEIRYPSDKPEQLNIYVHDKPVYAIKKLNLNENATPPHQGIRFNKEEKS